jgi:pyruvate/2-oxoglutarate dehydrogenase complex dihydrolipoamide acyltransferase (E2) component
MSVEIGETVVVRGTLAVVTKLETVAGQDFVGVVPLQQVQYVPASMVNAPAGPAAPTQPGGPSPATPAPAPAHPPARPGR